MPNLIAHLPARATPAALADIFPKLRELRGQFGWQSLRETSSLFHQALPERMPSQIRHNAPLEDTFQYAGRTTVEQAREEQILTEMTPSQNLGEMWTLDGDTIIRHGENGVTTIHSDIGNDGTLFESTVSHYSPDTGQLSEALRYSPNEETGGSLELSVTPNTIEELTFHHRGEANIFQPTAPRLEISRSISTAEEGSTSWRACETPEDTGTSVGVIEVDTTPIETGIRNRELYQTIGHEPLEAVPPAILQNTDAQYAGTYASEHASNVSAMLNSVGEMVKK